MRTVNICEYKKVNNILSDSSWLFVIKSQDQIARRLRMLESKRIGMYGRLEPRPTAHGLVVKGTLNGGQLNLEWKQNFREPRHIRKFKDDSFLLTEINRVLQIDLKGQILRKFVHPFFGYLHSVDLSADRTKALIVSSGYDAVIEIDIESGEESFSWFAWDHGYNPDKNGVWLAANDQYYKRYLNEDKKAQLVDPAKYGEQGLITSDRIAHPNVAVYDNTQSNPSIILSIGHKGELIRIRLSNGIKETVYGNLCVMAHGIFARKSGGWLITQTTKGTWLWLDHDFREEIEYNFSSLDGKVDGVGDAEWLQQVVPINPVYALGIDGNRGLIAVNIRDEEYTVYEVDPSWCIQDALILHHS